MSKRLIIEYKIGLKLTFISCTNKTKIVERTIDNDEEKWNSRGHTKKPFTVNVNIRAYWYRTECALSKARLF